VAQIGRYEDTELADLLREAIEALDIGDHIRFEDLHDEEAGGVLHEALLKLQEPELALDLVRRSAG
jgi:hypothetical protein